MLDPNIALGFRGMQITDPMEHMGKAMSLSNMGMQNQFMQSKMSEQNRLSNLAQSRQQAFAASGGDSDKFLSMLTQNGDLEGAQAFQEHTLKQQKDRAEIKSKGITDAKGLQELRVRTAQGIKAGGTVEHVLHGIRQLQAVGDEEGVRFLTSGLEQNPNPTREHIAAYLDPVIAAGLSAEQFSMPNLKDTGGQLVDVNPNTRFSPINKTQTPESIASNQTAIRGQDLSASTTIRGQNMANERAVEKNKIDAAQGPKLTEIQAKGQLYGKRMQEAHKIMTNLEGKYSPLAVNTKMGAADMPLIGGIAGAVGNTMLGKNEQLVEQAQRDFINATLRQESGAVISEPEFKNGQKQYFPQPGDSKAVLAQKRRNRETAIKAIDTMSGPAGGFAQPVTQSGNIDSLLEKYK